MAGKLFDEKAARFSWCHLYELPLTQLIRLNFPELVENEQFIDWHTQLSQTPGRINALPDIYDQVSDYFDQKANPTEEQMGKLRSILPDFSAYFYAVQYSLYCVLLHGCYMQELIARVRAGDDKALFDAVRIDPTVIGCKPIIDRISQAVRLRDYHFHTRLKGAMNGKIVKREQV